MIIIEDKSQLKFYLDKIDKDKKIGAIDIAGPIHEGHSFIISKCKELVDVLVVSYLSWAKTLFNFYKTGIWSDIVQYTFEQVKTSIQNSEETTKNIDFLVFGNQTNFIKQQAIDNNKNVNICYNFCKDLGVELLFNQVLTWPIIDEDLNLENLDYFTGPKNILIDLISRKTLNSNKLYKPIYIWDMFRSKRTSCGISRSDHSAIFGIIIKEIYDITINKNYIDINDINKIKHKYLYIKDLNISIIDMNTLEKLNKTNDNCIIVCNDFIYIEYLFIKNNKIMF